MSTPEDNGDSRIYKVVVNHEEQYSIWFAEREPPSGWREVGRVGPKEECLAYINEVWTDMRPLSLRKQMEEADASRETASRNASHEYDATVLYGRTDPSLISTNL